MQFDHRRPQRTLLGLSAFVSLLVAAECRGESSPSVEDLIKQGCICEAEVDTASALKCYKAVESIQPDNVDVLVRIARQYRHLMADASSSDEKLRFGQMALEYGQKAATLDPHNSDAQLSPAISYGKMLPLLSSKEQVQASPKIKAGAETALRLNPKNDLAWHILGRWHRVVSEISGVKKAIGGLLFGKLPPASPQEATKCLQKAADLAPNRLIHQVELGRAYASLGDKSKARTCLQKGLAMPATEKEDFQAKQDAKAALAGL